MKITIIDDKFTFLGNEVSNPVANSNNPEIKEQQQTDIRKAISRLFYNYSKRSSFYMTKTQQHEKFGIYKALVNTDTLGNEKFIVAIVPNDNLQIGSIKLLEMLRWVSFQTRETKNRRKEFGGLDLEPQNFVPSSNNISILNDKIHYEKTTRYSYVYMTENLPLKVEIIPTKEGEEYSDNGTIISALNLFSTVINLE